MSSTQCGTGSTSAIPSARDTQMLATCEDIGVDGANFCFFYSVKKEAHLLAEPTHVHDYDMWLINLNADPLHVDRFDGEIEMWWGKENEKQVMDSTSVAHVPPGLLHRAHRLRQGGQALHTDTCLQPADPHHG